MCLGDFELSELCLLFPLALACVITLMCALTLFTPSPLPSTHTQRGFQLVWVTGVSGALLAVLALKMNHSIRAINQLMANAQHRQEQQDCFFYDRK